QTSTLRGRFCKINGLHSAFLVDSAPLLRIVPPLRPPRRVTRRGGRVAEGARLESVYTGNRIEGSNPSPSAKHFSYENQRLKPQAPDAGRPCAGAVSRFAAIPDFRAEKEGRRTRGGC